MSDPRNISIGKGFKMGSFCQLFCQDALNGSELVIADNVSLNCNVMINSDCRGKIYIGNNVIIGPNTILRSANHKFDRMDVPIREQGHNGGTITIEEDVWIGGGVVILPDVKIGKGAVIGAGSIVTKDIQAYSIAVGNPARIIRSRMKT